eukprot:TRINITY_DN51472_c0_g1_i1.p1 TRINITY_DN51472_c0_g1~~TRINITY_DN51472_c0_g1_i1.p1  ORF type:complete len:256 (-),score=52.01 TRINITY_DN51472_c0_g1_i1:91-858(-)
MREGQAKAELLAAEATNLITDGFLTPNSIVCSIELVPQGSVGGALVAKARDVAADCIVMGTRGQGEIKSKLFGSVSQIVLNQADQIPVLIVHPGAADTRERCGHSVVFTLDGSERSLRALEQGACFVGEGASVYLFHSYQAPQKHVIPFGGLVRVTENRFYLQECAELEAKHAALKAQASERLAGAVAVPDSAVHLVLYPAHDPCTGIEQLRVKEGADMVVVGSRGDTGVSRVVGGSLAHDLLHKEQPFALLVTH